MNITLLGNKLLNMNKIKIAIVGLGYVGLPLARLFATKYCVVGFDINQKRISELKLGKDITLEVEDTILKPILKTKQYAFGDR